MPAVIRLLVIHITHKRQDKIEALKDGPPINLEKTLDDVTVDGFHEKIVNALSDDRTKNEAREVAAERLGVSVDSI